MAGDVLTDGGQNDAAAGHDAAAQNKALGVVGVDEADRQGRPDAETDVPQTTAAVVALSREPEHGRVIQHGFVGQRAGSKVRLFPGEAVQHGGGSFRFGAAQIAANAERSAVPQGEMSAKNTGLSMRAPQDLAFDHRRYSQTGAESDHHDIVAAAPGAEAPFADEGHPGVVVNSQRQPQSLASPIPEIKSRGIAEFS